MALELKEADAGKVLLARVTGKLTREDYDRLVPETEGLIARYGKLRILVEMHDFHGLTAGALWEELKFDLKHFNDFEKLAVVGEEKWQEWMTRFSKPFTSAEVRFYPPEDIAAARHWVRE